MKMQMDDLLTFFQSNLEKDFSYDDDTVVEQLQICMEELKKARMSLPPKSKTNEAPTLPFGLEIQPSVEQLIGRRSEETVDEHFRKNVPRQSSGKAAYLRRKNTGGSMTGGSNLLSTPELGRSHIDSRSLHSRMSQYSIDDKSSYYDTATNSRLSLVDYSTKTSAPSSRTSFGENSEMGSMSALGHGFTTPIDLDDVGAELATPTTPTNPPLPSNQYGAPSSPPRIMSQSYEQPKSSTAYDHQPTLKSSISLEMPSRRVVTTFDSSPGVVTSHEHTPQPSHQSRSSKTVPASTSSYDNSFQNTSHHQMKGSKSYEANHTSGSTTPKHSASYEQNLNRTNDHQTHYAAVIPAVADEHKITTIEKSDPTGSPKGSTTSDYDNLNNTFDSEGKEVNNWYGPRGDNVTIIPISKSDGFVTNTRAAEMVIINGYDGQVSAQMKVTKTDNDIQRYHQRERLDQRNIDYQNGFQLERQTSYQMSQATTSQTKSVYTKTIEKTAYL